MNLQDKREEASSPNTESTGTPPKTIICDDFEAMSQHCADLICEAVKAKPGLLLCLAAGNTAIRTYQILKERSDSGQTDFSKAEFVELDEWLDLNDESENCTSFMFKNFYGPLHIEDSKIHLFDIHAKDMEDECKKIDRIIFERNGIDFMLLGLGMNGHLALNEPGSSFESYAKVVTLDPVTQTVGQKYFSKPIRLSRGVTLGIRHILDARQVVLQAGGKAKAEIVKKIIQTKPTPLLPATVMQLVSNGVVVLDRDAASEIQ
ncbi:glucosamine-6-phosphate deaminase [Caproiciproducens faecalis]|uniref:Glucosamine-6-phosphate deaminase n=1 Tax=Caproiciproducens faecalis TaxID=2820301 RepID=A0ABS7DPD6_9FIRM|nr:glucosamine-6-phosphate deaminase [Caproiciproducens faecalis]MBW7573138.1 glucosamine-6-phosphate deaminase [Caproiciproducens faecalis]